MSGANGIAKILDTRAASTGVLVILTATALIYLFKRYGGKVAAAVGTAVNPFDADNLANRAVTGAGEVLTGDPSWSLGGSIYEWLHRTDMDQFDSYKFSGGRVVQVINRNTGRIFNVAADGRTLTPAN